MTMMIEMNSISNCYSEKRNNYKRGLRHFFITVSCCSVMLSCFAQQPDKNNSGRFPEDYPALHPRYRSWPVPAGNIEVTDNPPVLLWPSTLSEGTAYDVRLSQDKDFNAANTISVQDIPWTMYNPHRALAAGTWYWQYRVHNGTWSDIIQFRVGNGSGQAVSPPATEFLAAIPDTYPRVLIEKDEEQAFRQQVKSSADAQIIISKAEKQLTAMPPRDEALKHKAEHGVMKDDYMRGKLLDNDSKHIGFGAMAKVKLFCEAYILTGNRKYADKGILWAREMATWDPDGPSGVSDFGDAGCMLAMALAFDTFHDLLTAADREKLLGNINTRAARLYRSWINDVDAKVLSNHVWQFLFHYFFQTAIAMHGQLKDADNWLTYQYELWLARAPILGGMEGGWLEGASYFRINMETLLDVPTIIKKYTGFDFIDHKKWYANNPYWMYYSFPPGSSADGFGDNVETVFAPDKYYLAYADALSRLTGNRMAATYADKIEQISGIKLTDVSIESPETADLLRWFRLRYLMDTKRPAALPDSAFASALVLHDIGVVDMHSDITHLHKDLMISMRSSPYGAYGHMLADQNTFNVLYGGRRLFYMSGHKVAMKDPHRLGWYKATIGHNGILIDHKGQTFDPQGYGWIPRFLNGESITYAAGDASMAYGASSKKENTGLKKFRRHLLFLHPDILVVYDELSADHPSAWSWLIHSPEKISLDAAKNNFYCAVKGASAVTTLFASQPVRWALSDTFGVPAVNWLGRRDEDGNPVAYKNDQWHLSAVSAGSAAKMRFLAIMKINEGQSSARPINYRLNSKNEIIVGHWTIRAELDTSRPALLTASRDDGKVIFSSGGGAIQAGDSVYVGEIPGSARLAELINGKWLFRETGDRVPEVVKEIPVRGKHKQ